MAHAHRATGPPARSRRSRGFTLLELMIALAVFAIGVLGALAGQIAAMKLSSTSMSHGLALSLAEQKLEEFQATPLADVIAAASHPSYPNDPDNPIQLNPGGGIPLNFNRSWHIEQNQPETGMLRITVNVEWTDANGVPRTARVQGLKADW